MVFYVGSVRYQMGYVDRIKYFSQPRANNINSLPVSYTYERVFGGCMVWVYFWPNQPYLFNITGNFFMPPVSFTQDLTLQLANANLGLCTLTGTGTLTAGQFVINGFDLVGNYANVGALVTAINANVPFITASLQGNNQFTLGCSLAGRNILISSLGTEPTTNYINFSYFNTQGGVALNQTFFAQAFDQFYIDYMEYQLAERICQKLNFDVPPGVALQLARYQSQIVNLAEPMDLTMQKMSTMTDARAINYAQVNIGRAFTVSGV